MRSDFKYFAFKENVLFNCWGILKCSMGYYLDKFVYWSEKNSFCCPPSVCFFIGASAGRDNDQHFSWLWAIIQGKLLNSLFTLFYISFRIHRRKKMHFHSTTSFREWWGTRLPNDYIKNLQQFNLIISYKWMRQRLIERSWIPRKSRANLEASIFLWNV